MFDNRNVWGVGACVLSIPHHILSLRLKILKKSEFVGGCSWERWCYVVIEQNK
jgi:hypothetical protein